MKFRKAAVEDVAAIEELYQAIHTAEENGQTTTGWQRNIYPTRNTAEAGIARGDLFLCEEDGKVAAAAIINHAQVPEYRFCPWKYPASEKEVMVLHTLTVDPALHGKGLGTAFVVFYEKYALDQGCHYLRMDTQEENLPARALYRKLGYAERGIVCCTFNGIPGVRLVCLEKTV